MRFFLLMNMGAVSKWRGRRGTYFFFLLTAFFFFPSKYLLISLFPPLNLSFFLASCVSYLSSHLCSTSIQSSDICLILISPPISLQSLQSSSFISVAQLGGRRRFTLFAGTILLSHFSFLSPQSSEMRAGALSACSHPAVVHHHGSTGFLGLFGLA